MNHALKPKTARDLPNHIGVPRSVNIRALAATYAEPEGPVGHKFGLDDFGTVARALLVYDVTEHLPAVIASRLGAVAYRMAERHAAPTHVGRAILAELRAYIDAALYHRDAEGSLNRHRCKQCRKPHDACCTGEVPCPPKDADPDTASSPAAGIVRCPQCNSQFPMMLARPSPFCDHCGLCLLCVPPFHPHRFLAVKAPEPVAEVAS